MGLKVITPGAKGGIVVDKHPHISWGKDLITTLKNVLNPQFNGMAHFLILPHDQYIVDLGQSLVALRGTIAHFEHVILGIFFVLQFNLGLRRVLVVYFK